MMASKVRFEQIPPDKIEPNTENPRRTFDEERLDQLAESIRAKGVLVPITVYEKSSGRYVLLDGERRLRAAKRINLKTIPAWVTSSPDRVENLEAMFHIHMERDDWTRIDSLRALKKLIRQSGVSSPAKLQRMTGIPEHHIVELQRILSQPDEYQKLIEDGTLPFIFFTELHQRVILPLKGQRPKLFKKFNEAALIKAFVKRRQAGTLDNMTQLFRQVNAIIRQAAERGEDRKSQFDSTLERLFSDAEYPIPDAYEDVTGATLEIEKFVRHTERYRERLSTVIDQPLTGQQGKAIRKGLKLLLKDVKAALKRVRSE